MRNFFQKRIYLALLLLLLVFIIGISGYKLISHYTWVDAFYMTVITIATVGFREVRPLDPVEKIFTSGLILTSIFVMGYALTVITEYIFSKNDVSILRKKRVEKKIKKMDEHIIVCGYGRNGQQAVHKLLAYKKPFIVIEKDEEVVEKYYSELVMFIHGNANEDEILRKAGIEKAQLL